MWLVSDSTADLHDAAITDVDAMVEVSEATDPEVITGQECFGHVRHRRPPSPSPTAGLARDVSGSVDKTLSMTTEPQFVAGLCANCGSPSVTTVSSLYCGELCKQSANLVRYARACHSDGRDRSPDIREAIQMRMASVLGGGYPERARHVPDDVRSAVFERSGGLCENCGRKLDFERTTGDPDLIPTIQHMHGDSSDLSNLRAWCRRCNLEDAKSRFVPVEAGSSQDAYAQELLVRIGSPRPLFLCDDEKRWNSIWRQLARDAKDVIQHRSELEEGADATDLPGFAGYTDQGTPIQDI